MQPNNGNSVINNKKQQIYQDHRQPQSRSLERENKMKSQKDPKSKQEKHLQYDQIYAQPNKVIRTSSSQYDSLLEKLYQKQQQYTMDTKSHQQQHKVYRQAKQEITYLKNSGDKYSAYCIANKESNSGMFSHERFFVIDSINKQLRYYSNVPKLPLLILDDIQEKPKEILSIQRAQRFQLICSKRGIGQIEIKWVEIGQIKEWKIKMGNNTMAKEFAALVQYLRTGKHPIEERQKSNSQLKLSVMSPRSNKPFANFKKSNINSQIVPKKKQSGNNFADLLLQSMLNPNVDEETKKKQPKQKQLVNEEASALKNSNSQKKQLQKVFSHKNQKQKKTKQQIKISPGSEKNNKILIDQEVQATLLNKMEDDVGKIEQNKESLNQRLIQKKSQINEGQRQQQGQIDVFQSNNYHSIKSIKLQEIINNAIIQHQQKTNVLSNQRKAKNYQHSMISKPAINQLPMYSSVKPPKSSLKYQTPSKINKISLQFNHLSFSKQNPSEISQPQKHRLSALEKVVLRRKQFQEERHSFSPLNEFSIRDEMQLSKRIIKHISPQTPSKSIHPSPSNKLSTRKEQPPNPKFYSSTRQQQIYHRQHLLQQRKYAQTLKNPNSQKKAQPKVLNQHSHPRKERSRSKSLTSNIDNYLSTKSKPEIEWLHNWLCSSSLNEKCQTYRRFVDLCIQNVKSIVQNIDNWHLFHKAGQEYVVKKDQIEYRYAMFPQSTEEQIAIQNKQEYQMDELCYLWNIINQNENNNKQMKICLPLACKITFQGLSVYCKLDLSATNSVRQLITDLTIIQQTITNLYRWCRIRIKNGQLYQIKISNKRYIYINHAQARPAINEEPISYLNQNYVKSYVAGIISTQAHLEQISNHIRKNIIPDLLIYLNTSLPLSSLELQNSIKNYGFDLSILPLVFKHSTLQQYKRAYRLILSQICADAMADSISKEIHKFYLSKQLNKNMRQQIYKFIINTLRLDSDTICFQIWAKSRLSISLNQIKQKIIDSYVLCSLLIKLGIKCTIKVEFKEQYYQNINCCFWKQFQFNEQSIQLTFIPIVKNYNAKYLIEDSNYFQAIFSKKNSYLLKNQQYNKFNFLRKLGLTPGKEFYQSNYFKFLTVIQRQKITNFISKLQVFNNQCNSLSWPQQQNNPFFHMKNYNTSYYYCYESFEQILKGLYDLILAKKYSTFKQLFDSQLFRGWIWGSNHPLLLIQLQEIKSLFHKINNHHNLSLESCLLSLQISIKFYYEGVISPEIVLEKSQRAALLHIKYGKLQRGIQLFATCEKLFQKIVQSQSTKTEPIFKKYLKIYTSKAKLLIQTGKYKQTESQILQNMSIFFKWKQQFQQVSPQILNFIFKQQFRHYELLFRVKELSGKSIQLIMVMQECSNKYIETELQILIQHNLPININQMTAFSKQYFSEILKNIWVAIVSNTNHSKRSINQQNMNHYYLPLRNIDLTIIKNVVLQIKKQKPHLSPIKQEHFNYFINVITKKMQSFKSNSQLLFKNKPKSVLVSSIIDCLSEISELDKSKIDQSSSNYDQVELVQTVQKIITILGYQYSIGIIDSCLSSSYIQL